MFFRSLNIKSLYLVLLVTIILALLFRIFVLEAFQIPSGSMANTLLPGDFLLVYKLPHSPSTPKQIPYVNIQVPSFSIPRLSEPERDRIYVFKNPEPLKSRELKNQVNYIKRCVALPGDTLEIVNKKILINNVERSIPNNAIFNFTDSYSKSYSDERITPKGFGWNKDNFGPLIIPGKGNKIELNKRNKLLYQNIIERESGINVSDDDYVFKKNYYFMLGDNRDDSFDSRFFGLISEDEIIGTPVIIYWSFDSSKSVESFSDFFDAIRWNRILNFID
ncbi:MAG: signal peptidase I [Bacteroidetes bacterium]|nr:signal peptidase I [Bacteroidota bacterium]